MTAYVLGLAKVEFNENDDIEKMLEFKPVIAFDSDEGEEFPEMDAEPIGRAEILPDFKARVTVEIHQKFTPQFKVIEPEGKA